MNIKHKEKINVIMLVNDLAVNGISTVVYNYCMNIDLTRFEVTVAAGEPIDNFYKDAYKERGIQLAALPSRKKSSKEFYKALFKLLRSGKYDIFHIHGNSATVTPELFLAWLSGIKVRIMHSHNTTCGHMKIHKIMMPFFKRICTAGFACGQLAGNWIFGENNFTVIPNGFNPEKLIFNEEKRNQVRRQLGIEDKYVIGHVGRFNAQKNHPFLLDVFEKIAQQNNNAVLLLVGKGPDFETICSRIAKSPFKDRIIIYGESQDMAALYSAMDVFVLPSKHEGLGIVLLEAQINGLHCIASDVIPQETKITDNIEYISLAQPYEQWVQKILDVESIDLNRLEVYEQNITNIKKYDIKETVHLLEKRYTELYKGEK